LKGFASRTFSYEIVQPNENSLVEILAIARPKAKLLKKLTGAPFI
jgi:hypothetical protein